MKLTGIILAGGKSSRMQQDKSLVKFKGKKLIEWLILLLEGLCDFIIISSNNPEMENLGYKVVEDEYKNIGSISGLFTALKVSKTQDNIVIACDTPLLNKSVYEKLLEGSGNYDAVVAGISENYIELLIAYYNKNVVNVLENQICNKRYKLLDVLDHLKYKLEIIQDKNLFRNINYPSDLS